jgi:hypothetical protein
MALARSFFTQAFILALITLSSQVSDFVRERSVRLRSRGVSTGGSAELTVEASPSARVSELAERPKSHTEVRTESVVRRLLLFILPTLPTALLGLVGKIYSKIHYS